MHIIAESSSWAASIVVPSDGELQEYSAAWATPAGQVVGRLGALRDARPTNAVVSAGDPLLSGAAVTAEDIAPAGTSTVVGCDVAASDLVLGDTLVIRMSFVAAPLTPAPAYIEIVDTTRGAGIGDDLIISHWSSYNPVAVNSVFVADAGAVANGLTIRLLSIPVISTATYRIIEPWHIAVLRLREV